MYFLFDWCSESGVKAVFGLIKTAISIIRWVVPIGLVVMTSIDLFTKVLNPDDKDAQKKILNRAIAAIIVFFVPIIVNLTLKLVDVGMGNDYNTKSSVSECMR